MVAFLPCGCGSFHFLQFGPPARRAADGGLLGAPPLRGPLCTPPGRPRWACRIPPLPRVSPLGLSIFHHPSRAARPLLRELPRCARRSPSAPRNAIREPHFDSLYQGIMDSLCMMDAIWQKDCSRLYGTGVSCRNVNVVVCFGMHHNRLGPCRPLRVLASRLQCLAMRAECLIFPANRGTPCPNCQK